MSVICSYINWVINSALFLIFKFHIFLCLGTLSLLHLGLDDKNFLSLLFHSLFNYARC